MKRIYFLLEFQLWAIPFHSATKRNLMLRYVNNLVLKANRCVCHPDLGSSCPYCLELIDSLSNSREECTFAADAFPTVPASAFHSYTRVVCFLPTARDFQPPQYAVAPLLEVDCSPVALMASIGGKAHSWGAAHMYVMPYSDHSSYAELMHFVQLLRPQSVLPSVAPCSADTSWDVASQLNSLLH